MITRECILIQRVPTGSYDRFGNDQDLDATEDALCELQQRTPNERGDSGEVSDDEWRVFFLPGVDLSTASAVQVDGEVYELVGDPWVARNPRTGATSHIEVKARRTAGALDGS